MKVSGGLDVETANLKPGWLMENARALREDVRSQVHGPKQRSLWWETPPRNTSCTTHSKERATTRGANLSVGFTRHTGDDHAEHACLHGGLSRGLLRSIRAQSLLSDSINSTNRTSAFRCDASQGCDRATKVHLMRRLCSISVTSSAPSRTKAPFPETA